MHPSKMYRLACFEEAAGILHGLTENEGSLVAHIGQIHLGLALGMEESLRPLIGRRITILRTNLPDKSYLFREITHEPNYEEKGMVGG